MTPKLSKIEIDKTDPFMNCKLNRKPYAKVLTKIIVHCNDGCVMSINGEWGSGKTTFINMWRTMLESYGFKTLYFNVWEQDFVSDPIIGFVNQFRRENNNENIKRKMASLYAASAQLMTNVFPVLATSLAKHYGLDCMTSLIKAIFKSTQKICQESIENYKKQCDSLEQFQNALIDMVSSYTSDGKPLIFFVDELDRCNPNYAVKVLERIKHIFCVENIVFVLSIDKKQLCNSICGYFGSDKIDSEEYLKRFIDVEYNLPEPDVNLFCDYLYDKFMFKDFFNDDIKSRKFKELSNLLLSNTHRNLRYIEKLYAQIKLALLTYNYVEKKNFIPDMLLLLAYIRVADFELYKSIRNRKMSVQDLLSQLEDLLPPVVFDSIESCQYHVKEDFIKETITRLILEYDINDNFKNREIDFDNKQQNLYCKKLDTNELQKAIRDMNKRIHETNIFCIDDIFESLELIKDFD